MCTTSNKPDVGPVPSKSPNSKPPDIASSSVPDTLSSLKVNPETGLTRAEVEVQRKENRYNEVAEKKATRSSDSFENSVESWCGCSN